MNRRDELEIESSCFNKAADDEPLFVLRAKDPLAANTVRAWCVIATDSGQHEPAKIAEARALADSMEAWRAEHYPQEKSDHESQTAPVLDQ